MDVLPILAFCARASMPERLHDRLRSLAQDTHQWEDVATEANAHGLVPLLIHHFTTVAIPIPDTAKTVLYSSYVQHLHAARVRSEALLDLVDLYGRENIPFLLLKGSALCISSTPNLTSVRCGTWICWYGRVTPIALSHLLPRWDLRSPHILLST